MRRFPKSIISEKPLILKEKVGSGRGTRTPGTRIMMQRALGDGYLYQIVMMGRLNLEGKPIFPQSITMRDPPSLILQDWINDPTAFGSKVWILSGAPDRIRTAVSPDTIHVHAAKMWCKFYG
mgnify:CR=1 FL=1